MTEPIVDKDALIDSLQEELTLLGRQVGEFNDLRLSIVNNNNNNLKNLTATLYAARSEDLFYCHVLHHSNPA